MKGSLEEDRRQNVVPGRTASADLNLCKRCLPWPASRLPAWGYPCCRKVWKSRGAVSRQWKLFAGPQSQL